MNFRDIYEKKKIIKKLEQIIYKGFLETPFYFGNFCLTFRSLFSSEENEIVAKNTIIASIYENEFVSDILAESLYRINGKIIPDFESKKEIFLSFPRNVLRIFYFFYKNEITSVLKYCLETLEEYSKTGNSKYYWKIFDKTGKISDSTIDQQVNYIQTSWIYLNTINEDIEKEKKEWERVKYMTESICGFLDPKAMRKIKQKSEFHDKILKEYGGEEGQELIRGILEMQTPEDRQKFTEDIRNISDVDNSILTCYPKLSDETDDIYKDRIKDTIRKIIIQVETEESHHEKEVKLFIEKCFVNAILGIKQKIDIRNQRIKDEVFLHSEENAELEISERKFEILQSQGFEMKADSQDPKYYMLILHAQGLYKDLREIPFNRRVEIFSNIHKVEIQWTLDKIKLLEDDFRKEEEEKNTKKNQNKLLEEKSSSKNYTLEKEVIIKDEFRDIKVGYKQNVLIEKQEEFETIEYEEDEHNIIQPITQEVKEPVLKDIITSDHIDKSKLRSFIENETTEERAIRQEKVMEDRTEFMEKINHLKKDAGITQDNEMDHFISMIKKHS